MVINASAKVMRGKTSPAIRTAYILVTSKSSRIVLHPLIESLGDGSINEHKKENFKFSD